MATALFGDRAGASLGEVVLHPHQQEAVERLTRLLAIHRGALLADDVGLGKTFVALAVARAWPDRVVVAPAALRDSWLAAARRARVPVDVVSLERLSRSTLAPRAGLVVIDEAHHLRNPGTLRFHAVAELCRDATVLLLSATPVQNALRDLRATLSLFLGQRAHGLTEHELAGFVVRRTAPQVGDAAELGLPTANPPRWMDVGDDVDCLGLLLALPPPMPPADGGDAGALVVYGLARQWASSRGALRGALRRRLAQARAMEDLLNAGRAPTRQALRGWCLADDAQQLAFPELLDSHPCLDAARLLEQVEAHAAGLRRILALLERSRDPDDERADALRRVLADHPGEQVVAFSEFAETIRSLYRRLARNTRVAMLTHAGGRVAGGPVHRRDLLACFTPRGARATTSSDRVELLLTTDVLSEGVDLHAASVVVHLDIGWNPARLEQRVGRLRRLGAPRPVIAQYLLRPPAPAEALLQLERRLRAKLGIAARSVGVAGAILPGLIVAGPEPASLSGERLFATMSQWRRIDVPAGASEPLVAAAPSEISGALACVRSADETTLLAIRDGVVSRDPDAVLTLVRAAEERSVDVDAVAAERAAALVGQWIRRQSVASPVSLSMVRVAGARRALLRRVDAIVSRAPRQRQPALAPLVRVARATASITLSAGAERVLEVLAGAQLSDEAWLHALGEFAALHAAAPEPPALVALLLLGDYRDAFSISRR